MIKSISSPLLALLMALAAQVHAAPLAKAVVDQGLVIEGVTVVDVKSGRLAPGMSLVIQDGKISRIARASSMAVRGNVERVDARGQFVVPGYLDMHAHPLNAADPRPALALMLSNGVTGYRQMSGSPELLQARAAGKLDFPQAPELLALPGTILTDTLTPTPEAAVAEVRAQKAQGADFIKTVGLSSKNFYAAGNEARAQGLTYSGHMNMDIDVRQGAKIMRSIEHLGPLEVMLLGCSSDEASIRDFVSHTHSEPPQVGPATPAMQAMLARIIANPMMMTKPHQFESMQRVIDSFDEGRCRELARELVKDGSWQVPTLIRLRTMQVADDPVYRNDPANRFMPPPVRQMWNELGTQFAQRVSPANREVYKRFFVLQLRFTKLLQEAGVPMLAGSDAGGSIWVVPGFSLHQDFDLFAQAGLTPLQVLQIATLNGARFLGRESTMGTVEAGKNADLVLLDANPLADVGNLHRIAGVVRAGSYYSLAALHRLQADALP